MVPTVSESTSKKYSQPIPGQSGPKKQFKTAEDIFFEEKKKYGYISSGILGSLLLFVSGCVFNKRADLPAKCLQVLGDAFGTAATVLLPAGEIANEISNYKTAKAEHNKTQEGKKNSFLEYFDKNIKKVYRICSHGLFPYIYERLLNPENISKSIFHKAAAILNIPFIAFTGITWAFGNTQALIAMNLRDKEQKKVNDSTNGVQTEHRLRANALDEICLSAERMIKIGSTANPVMPCLQYCADGLHSITQFFKGENSIKDLLTRPILSLSKALSMVVALPEAYAKGVDAFMRVFVTEREHLKPVLPGWIYKQIESTGNKVEKSLQNKDSKARAIKNSAEMLFHTVSPFAMISLFAPMLDRNNTSEEAQTKGGVTAFLDKWLGRYAKSLSVVFTGFYVAFSRLPQGVFQSIYFGRKLIGKHIKKENEETTQNALIALRERIYNNSIVKNISEITRKFIKFCVPNFYDVNAKNEYGDPTYKQVLAEYGLAQEKGTHKLLFNILDLYSITDEKERIKKREDFIKTIDLDTLRKYKSKLGLDIEEDLENAVNLIESTKEKITDKIVAKCLEYADTECAQGGYDLNLIPDDIKEIEELVRNKVNYLATPPADRKSEKLLARFPGALFLTRVFATAFDIRSFLPSWKHDKLNKLEYYQGKEMNKAFTNELELVGAENADGARRFINWIQGVASPLPTH